MIRRPAEETAVEFRPSLQRSPTLDEIPMALRQLPDPIGRLAAVGRLEGHQLGVFRSGCKVEQASDRF